MIPKSFQYDADAKMMPGGFRNYVKVTPNGILTYINMIQNEIKMIHKLYPNISTNDSNTIPKLSKNDVRNDTHNDPKLIPKYLLIYVEMIFKWSQTIPKLL